MMPEIIQASVAQPRFRTFLLGLFAAMALVLAAIREEQAGFLSQRANRTAGEQAKRRCPAGHAGEVTHQGAFDFLPLLDFRLL